MTTSTAATGATAARLLADVRTEIASADSKASILAGTLSVSTGVMGSLLAGSDWSPLRLSALAAVLWWAGATALVVSLLALLLAVLPRFGSGSWRPGQPLTYFGDIQRACQLGELATAIADTEQSAESGLLAALTATSRIAARKHAWIRVGVIAFCSGALLVPAALLVH